MVIIRNKYNERYLIIIVICRKCLLIIDPKQFKVNWLYKKYL